MERIKHVNSPIVYFLYKNDELIYIGQGTKGLVRACGHPEFDYDYIEYELTTLDNINELEAGYILKYQPINNKSIPSNIKYLSKEAIKRKYSIYGHDFNIYIKKYNIPYYKFNKLMYFNISDLSELLNNYKDYRVCKAPIPRNSIRPI